MKKVKQWAVALTVLAVLAGATVYQSRNSQIELVEAKADLDLSTLHPANPGCAITGPDGRALDLSSSQIIPHGTLISSKCFGAAKL